MTDKQKNIWKKIAKGDGIDDQELEYAVHTLTPVVEFLTERGEQYSLVANELRRELNQLNNFKRLRHTDARLSDIKTNSVQ